MKAFLKNYRQSPRKVRLVASLLKGKKVQDALLELDFLAKRASTPLKKLVESAVANAKATGANVEDLFIKEFRVDKGLVMKRFMPRAMGRASRINKRTSHVFVVLGEKAQINGKKSRRKVGIPTASVGAKKIAKKVTK